MTVKEIEAKIKSGAVFVTSCGVATVFGSDDLGYVILFAGGENRGENVFVYEYIEEVADELCSYGVSSIIPSKVEFDQTINKIAEQLSISRFNELADKATH